MGKQIQTSKILSGVKYEIRGQLANRAHELEKRGYEIISLNIGNPGLFGFRTPETMRLAMIENMAQAEPYCHQKGIFPAREAVVMQQQTRGVQNVSAEEVFIGNILKCRPPGNRDPKPDEIQNCWPYLKHQLEILQPEIIVALGAHAARTLLDTKEAIGKLRGQFHEYKFSDDVPPSKLMPTYHPAYLLRNYSYDNRKRVWEDMMKVLKELDLPVPKKKG